MQCASAGERSSTSLAPSRTGWDEATSNTQAEERRDEISLHILAYNIKRAVALIGVSGLIAAMQA